MECIFFLSAKRDHLLSASPLILIKEFIELRCFSKRIEGHALILFLREGGNGNVAFMFSELLQRWGKKQEQSRKNPPCLLPVPQPGDRVCLTTLFVLQCPLVKQYGIQHKAVKSLIAQTIAGQPILLAL